MSEKTDAYPSYCPQCQCLVEPDAKFCKNCAYELANMSESSELFTNHTQPKRHLSLIIIGVGGLCVIFIGIALALSIFPTNNANALNSNINNNTNNVNSTILSLSTKAQQAEAKILNGEMLLPNDIEGLSTQELRILRNAHFAKYGRKYEKPGLGEYFFNCSWYKPNDNYSDSLITPTDKANINLILGLENGANPPLSAENQPAPNNQIGDGENSGDDLPDNPANSLDQDAQQQAKIYWEKNYKSCGDSHFQHLYFPYHEMSQSPAYEVYVELKGFNWRVEGSIPQPKTEAERLNQRDTPSGIEWKGKTILFTSALRYWASRNLFDTTAGWNKWQDRSDPFEIVEIIKQSGTWKFNKQNQVKDSREIRSVNCNEIPK